jgi:hypothetical protein
MAIGAISQWHIALDTKTLNAALAGNLVGGIEKVAQQSVLIKVPAIAASYAALVAKNTTLGGLVAAVVADDKQLKADTAARDLAYNAVLLELTSLKSLVMSNATSPADITAMGFTLLNSAKASQTRPDPPVALIVKPGKVHGKARVTVQETGTTRGRYVAEASPTPITPTSWAPLPGNGKQRKLSGYPSGTQLWVHFAQVRYGLQSDWSTPVLVTIP